MSSQVISLHQRELQNLAIAGVMVVGAVASPAFVLGAAVGLPAVIAEIGVNKIPVASLMPGSCQISDYDQIKPVPSKWRLTPIGDAIARLAAAVLFQGLLQTKAAALLASASFLTPASAVLISVIVLAILGTLVQMQLDPMDSYIASLSTPHKVRRFVMLSMRNVVNGLMMAYYGPAAMIGSALGQVSGNQFLQLLRAIKNQPSVNRPTPAPANDA